MHHVGDESASEFRFEFAFCPIVEHRSRSFDSGTGVSKVVGENLLCVWATSSGESANTFADYRIGEFNCPRCNYEICSAC